MKCQAKRVGEQSQEDVRFGFVDKKRRHVGVIVSRHEVELIPATPEASWWNVEMPPGPAFFWCVMPARNGQTFGSSSAYGYTATAKERELCIAKAVGSTRKRYEKQFGASGSLPRREKIEIEGYGTGVDCDGRPMS